jgi:hypothetical protein
MTAYAYMPYRHAMLAIIAKTAYHMDLSYHVLLIRGVNPTGSSE